MKTSHFNPRLLSPAAAELFLVRPMRASPFSAIVILFLFVGCAATRERAVGIALREIASRKLPLPETYSVHVRDVVHALEAERSYNSWEVEFGASGRQEPLYSVSVDQRNGTVEDFKDYRRH